LTKKQAMIDDIAVLKQWETISDKWKTSERQEWFHKYILEPFFVEYLLKEFCHKRIIDFGCGSGELLNILIQLGIDAEGYEPVKGLHKRAIKNNIKVFNQLTLDIKYSYDLVILNLVLSSVSNPNTIIQSAKSLLQTEGKIIVTLPHPCFSIISKYHKTTIREWVSEHLYGDDDLLRYFLNPIPKIHWDSSLNNFTFSFYRTIEWYSNLFSNANLKVENIFEPKPIPSPESMDDLYKIYSSFPSFLIFVLNA
jgi:2-polyprenyl-3-methyl-5-hydroxy-6-metoxy-1,4-benzoquinol methylase